MDAQRQPRRAEPAEPARGGQVVPLRRPPAAENRFGMHDRIELLGWTAAARAAGLNRVVLEQPEPEDDPATVGDFVLIYGSDPQWARWGLARQDAQYEVWRPSSGHSLGRFASLREALAAIEGAA